MSWRSIPTEGAALAKLLRSIMLRLSRLESRPDGRPDASHELPMVLGGYTLSEDDDGNLVATNTTTGSETVIAIP